MSGNVIAPTGVGTPTEVALEALQAVAHYFWTAEREPGGLREWDVEGLVRGAIGALSSEMALNKNRATKTTNSPKTATRPELGSLLTEGQITSLWIRRHSIHDGQIIPQLIDLVRAVEAYYGIAESA